MGKRSRILRRGWAWLGSLRLATALLVVLTLATIVGGIVPQAPITPNASDLYAAYGPFWERLITRLGLGDVFHSWWFFALVGLFAMNLSLCTGRRMRRSLQEVFRPPRFSSRMDGEDVPIDHGRNSEDVACTVMTSLRRAGLRKIDRVRDPSASETQLVAQRFRFGALGADLVHVGILVILIGALLGIFRQEGTFAVTDWERGLRLPACADGTSNDCVPLPYDFQVDDFGVEVYEESGRTKSFWANLSFWEGETQVASGRTAVNRPFSIRGLGFYPWRYGQDSSASAVRLHVVETDRNLVIGEVALRIGETAPVPGTSWTLTALRFFQTFALDDFGQAVDLGNVPGGNPAVLLQVSGDEGTYRDIALPFLPETATQPMYSFLLAESTAPAFLQIHYVRSPGYRVVWIGFILVMVGLAAALYFAPSRVRISINEERVAIHAESRRAGSHLGNIVERIELDLAETSDPDNADERIDA